MKNLHYRYEVKSIFGESEILNELSDHLADEVAINAYRKIVNIFPILQLSKGRLVRLLCVAMKPCMLKRMIFCITKIALPGLFFVKTGMVIFTRIKGMRGEEVVENEEGSYLLCSQLVSTLARMIKENISPVFCSSCCELRYFDCIGGGFGDNR